MSGRDEEERGADFAYLEGASLGGGAAGCRLRRLDQFGAERARDFGRRAPIGFRGDLRAVSYGAGVAVAVEAAG